MAFGDAATDRAAAGLLACVAFAAEGFAEGVFAAGAFPADPFGAAALVVRGFADGAFVVAALGAAAFVDRVDAGFTAAGLAAAALVVLADTGFAVAGLAAAGLVREGVFGAAGLRPEAGFPEVFRAGFLVWPPLLSSLIWENSNHSVVRCLQPEHETRTMGTPRVKKAH
ncbi:MAG: hypothetical protein ABJL55_12995 [Roseibium sp.]